MVPTLYDFFLDMPRFFEPVAAKQDAREVTETKDAWHVTLDVPGVPKDKLEVQVAGRRLTVKGEGKRRSFTRTFTLPETVSQESIEAKLDLGVLELVIPKRGQDVKLIAIN